MALHVVGSLQVAMLPIPKLLPAVKGSRTSNNPNMIWCMQVGRLPQDP